MGQQIKPTTYVTKCDSCDKEVVMNKPELPSQWFLLRLNSDFYRYPVLAGVTPHRYLCKDCGDKLRKVLNTEFPGINI